MFLRSVLLVGFLAVACSSEQVEPLPEQGSGGADMTGSGGATDTTHSGGAPSSVDAGGMAGESGGSSFIDPNADECTCGRKNDYTGTLPLACVCSERECPSFADVSAPIDTCPSQGGVEWGPILRRGCGIVEYERGSYSGGGKSRFDAETGELVAVGGWSDIGRGGPCGTPAYEAGPFEDCPDFVECLNCLAAGGETRGLPLCSELE